MKKLNTLMKACAASALMFLTATSAHAGILYLSVDGDTNGLYTLDTTTGIATLSGAGNSGVTSSTVGLAPSADASVLYASQWFDINVINADGSGVTLLGDASAEALAFNPLTGVLYGGINGSFFSISTTTGAIDTNLAAPGSDVEGLAYGNGGIYGLDTNSMLMFYDIALNTWTNVGSTGLATGFGKGLAFDNELGVLYAISGQDTSLFALSASTGQSRLIGNTGLNFVSGGLAFVSSSTTAVSEPSLLALFGLGMLALVFRQKKHVNVK